MRTSSRSRHRWLHLPHDHGEPISRPRYDVVAGMAALFVGMVAWVNAPMPAHAITVELPVLYDERNLGDLSPYYNRLSIDRHGTVTWNSESVDQREVLAILAATVQEPIQPALAFEPDGDAAYGDVALLLALVGQVGLIDRCFVLSDTARFGRLGEPTSVSARFAAQRRECWAAYGY